MPSFPDSVSLARSGFDSNLALPDKSHPFQASIPGLTPPRAWLIVFAVLKLLFEI
jgi:hypothetical protein